MGIFYHPPLYNVGNQQPLQEKLLVPPQSQPQNPPFMGAAAMALAVVLGAWTPAPPQPIVATNLNPPLSQPQNPPVIGGRVPVEIFNAWLPSPPPVYEGNQQPYCQELLTPPISAPQNPPVIGSSVPLPVLVAWIPPDPAFQTARLLNPPISAPLAQNPPFPGTKVPQSVLNSWSATTVVSIPINGLPSAAAAPGFVLPLVSQQVVVQNAWLPPDPPFQTVRLLVPPRSAPQPTPVGSRVPLEVQINWIPPDPQFQTGPNLTLSTFQSIGTAVPLPVLISWLPTDPAFQTTRLLSPPIEAPVVPFTRPLVENFSWQTPPASVDFAFQVARNLVPPSGPAPQNPPFPEATSQQFGAILETWLPPDPAFQTVRNLSPPVSVPQNPSAAVSIGVPLPILISWAKPPAIIDLAPSGVLVSTVPQNPPVIGTKVPIEILVGWIPPPPQPIRTQPRLPPSGPAGQPPPPVGAKVPVEVLISWLPPDPMFQIGASLTEPSGPAVQNPPFPGTKVPVEIQIAWLPHAPQPQTGARLTPPQPGPAVPIPFPGTKVSLEVLSWYAPPIFVELPESAVLRGPAYVLAPASQIAVLDAWIAPDPPFQIGARLTPRSAPPPTPIGTKVSTEILASWLPPAPAFQAARLLSPPRSVPQNPPLIGSNFREAELLALLPPILPLPARVQTVPPPIPQNPPFAGGAQVPLPVLLTWLPPDPAPIVGASLTEPSGPAPTTHLVGARLPDEVQLNWLPPDPQPIVAPPLTPPNGPTPQNPPFPGSRAPLEIIQALWSPISPQPQTAPSLTPPSAHVQPFGSQVPAPVMVWWQSIEPPAAQTAKLRTPPSAPQKTPIGSSVPLPVLAWWQIPPPDQVFIPKVVPQTAFLPRGTAIGQDVLSWWVALAPDQVITAKIVPRTAFVPRGVGVGQDVLSWWAVPAPDVQTRRATAPGLLVSIPPLVGAKVPVEVLVNWLAPEPIQQRILAVPSGPFPFAGAKEPLEIEIAWLGYGYQPDQPLRLPIPVSAPQPQNPPFLGSSVPLAVLIGWVPPDPAYQVAVNLDPANITPVAPDTCVASDFASFVVFASDIGKAPRS